MFLILRQRRQRLLAAASAREPDVLHFPFPFGQRQRYRRAAQLREEIRIEPLARFDIDDSS
jgi:hypothetical protein